MDVVSDAIAAVRIGRPSSNRLRVHGAWRARIPAYDGAGFHVVLAGGCWLLPDGGAPLVLGPGDAVLLPHGTGHVLADAALDAEAAANATPIDQLLTPARPQAPADGDAPADADPDDPDVGAAELLCGKYRLDHSRTHPLMAELPDVVHLPNRLGRHPELRAAVDLLGGELAADRPGGALAVPGLIDLLLVYMVRAWLTREPATRPAQPPTAQPSTAQPAGARWPAALHDPVVAAALRAVHEDPAHPWTTDRLAERAGVSRATLTRRFTALVGSPPMAYLTWWRLTRAAALLRDTAHPLEAVARRVGYSTPYALSHAFTRLFGTTPGRYRTGATRPA
ncbi:cupin domain-containing protein [Kitasatospora sp. NPDC052868]|uniref:AraC family transcriptional regulator n=1 Tax=Kitasatospora sp. NPDC052868 TaxID=3364060 RepID=UPI0037CAE768